LTSADPSTAPTVDPRSIFSRIVVGVDGTEPAFEACRQAARLADPDASIEAVAVVHLADTVRAGVAASRTADRLEQEAEAAVGRAAEILGPRTVRRFVNGYVTRALSEEVDRFSATLLALGSHGHHRMTEIAFGGPAGELLHEAPCSILLARTPRPPQEFPRSLVVGYDGSAGADLALATAQAIVERFGSRLRIVAADDGDALDLARVHKAAGVELVEQHPVDALCGESETADLVVVGSRGLRGFRALGSVSERVAHRAACSVLVVRRLPPVAR